MNERGRFRGGGVMTDERIIFAGPSTACAVCVDQFGDGEQTDEGGFSWSACDLCGSSLGGNRYAAHEVPGVGPDRGDDPPDHLDVCEECLVTL